MTLGRLRRRLFLSVFVIFSLLTAENYNMTVNLVTLSFAVIGGCPIWDRTANFGKGSFKSFLEL